VKFYRVSLRESVEIDAGPLKEGVPSRRRLGAPTTRHRDWSERPPPRAGMTVPLPGRVLSSRVCEVRQQPYRRCGWR
jgi:hypothetical protein